MFNCWPRSWLAAGGVGWTRVSRDSQLSRLCDEAVGWFRERKLIIAAQWGARHFHTYAGMLTPPRGTVGPQSTSSIASAK